MLIQSIKAQEADLVELITVSLSSTVKFVFGPIEGLAMGLPWLVTALCTATGMMLSVVVITFFYHFLKKHVFPLFQRRKKLFTPTVRRNVRLWRKYGIYGVATLTPLLLTPIGGAVIANAFGEKKYRIFFWMTLNALFWGVAITLMVYEVGDLLGITREIHP